MPLVEPVEQLLRARNVAAADTRRNFVERIAPARLLLRFFALLHDFVISDFDFSEHARGIVARFAVQPFFLVVFGFQA